MDAYLPRLMEAGQSAGSPFYLAVAQANRAWASAQPETIWPMRWHWNDGVSLKQLGWM